MSGNKVQPFADGGGNAIPAVDPNQDSAEKGLISIGAVGSDAEEKKQAVADVTYGQIFSRFVSKCIPVYIIRHWLWAPDAHQRR